MGERFSQLPLPAAHLVVDIRGGSDRRSIDWLQVELTDLASEMQSLNVPRWRAVNEFLSFLRLSPDVQGSREDAVQMKKDRLVQEIEHVRESRARAMQEDSQAGHAGHSSDTRVRVLFLVDLIFPASLSCALLWAKHLKNHYGKHMQSARHGGLCIAVVCLGNVEEEGRPEFLRQELGRYQAGIYLDTLIFSENCYQSPPLEERAQGWLAAQLLYALLLFFSPSFTFFSPEPAAPLSGSEEGPQPAIWPGQIYLVHVAALEDTARWGRHWLNHGLAQALIETLCLPHDLSEQEKIQAADLGISWFRDWLGRLL
jgi:hypothetical protein